MNRFWHVGNRLPPMQIKEVNFRGEQGSKGWENVWSALRHIAEKWSETNLKAHIL